MEFTQLQKEVITGSLLGDGYIWINLEESFNCKFSKAQSQVDYHGVDKFDYLDWHRVVFHPFSSSIKPASYIGIRDKIYYKYTFNTEMNSLFNEVESKWYVLEKKGKLRRRKIVPNDITLTAISACIWMMDDGCNNSTDANVELNTQGFTRDEVQFLISRLKKDLDICAWPKNDRGKQQKIFIGRKSYFDFLDIIRPYVAWGCFKYKLDTSGYTKLPHRGETHSLSKLTEESVREIFTLKESGWLQKDIATKLGVNRTEISHIINGKRWSHLPGVKRGTTKKKTQHFSKEQKEHIIKLDGEGMTQKEIAKLLDRTQSTISRVLKSARGAKCQI